MEECKSGHVVVLCVANYVVTSDCYLSTSACVWTYIIWITLAVNYKYIFLIHRDTLLKSIVLNKAFRETQAYTKQSKSDFSLNSFS